jgi:glycosyltransferase involved in cell wall biosynthesis
MSQMRTILILAYDVSPYRGSEASVSWNYIISMMHTNRLIVLYGRGKDEVEHWLKTNNMPNVSFHNITFSPSRGRGLLRDIRSILRYRKWHKKAYERAKTLIEQENIDLIHYVCLSGFKEPGYLWKLDKPYIWGPIQGVHNRPLKLYAALSLTGKLEALTRRIVHNGLLRYSLRVRKAIKRADCLFAATPTTHRQLKTLHHKENYYLPENAILAMESNSPVRYDKRDTFNLIWVGSLCEAKALVILLDVLGMIKNEPFLLHVVGSGVLLQKLKTYAEKKGLSDKIVWHGQVDRVQVQEIFKKAHLHIITSLGEGNPTVLLEAMSKGIPTMTLDHCGMSGVVCEKCGIKIPIKSYKQVVNDMASNIVHLIEYPEEITKLSEGTLECAAKYTWDKRIELLNGQYEATIAHFYK